jgi:hypothetical protein
MAVQQGTPRNAPKGRVAVPLTAAYGRKRRKRMLIATPKRWFSWDFEVREGGGAPVADLKLSMWRERGAITVGGIEFGVTREGLVGAFILEGAGGALARAEKPSAFRRAFAIESGGRQYALKAASVWGRSFALLDGDREIGAVSSARVFSRQACADLPEDMPLEVRSFMIWLVLMIWKRQQQSSSSG